MMMMVDKGDDMTMVGMRLCIEPALDRPIKVSSSVARVFAVRTQYCKFFRESRGRSVPHNCVRAFLQCHDALAPLEDLAHSDHDGACR